jgi:hypothetical protein
MTKRPNRVRILMMPHQDGEGCETVGYSGPASLEPSGGMSLG